MKEDYTRLLPWFVKQPHPRHYSYGIPLFLDFETTNHSKGSALDPKNRLVLAVWQLGDGPMRSLRGNEYEMAELVAAVDHSDFIVAHNAKFELQWLERCGVPLEDVIVFDTMIADYVIGGNRYQMQNLGLEACLKRHGLPGKVGVVSKMIKAGICPSEIPEDWLLRYCKRDVSAVIELFYLQLDQLEDEELLPVMYNRCLLTPVLADLETVGLQLDPDLVRTKYEEISMAYAALERSMNDMTGGINPRSGKQVTAYLYDTLGFNELRVRKGREWVPKRTPSGQRAKDADTILALEARTKAQKAFKDLYVELNDKGQQLSKYISKFKKCVDEAGGELYADFNQTNTQTHRLSSTGRAYSAQFQNFPRVYKPLFRAKREGWLIAEADGAQLEFRVAAHLGRCAAAFADIEADVDVHSYTASVLTAAGQPTNRQDAKSHTFKPLYGGQSGTEAEQTYYKAFREKYPGIANAQQQWIAAVLEHKKLRTEWGLTFYWPDTRMDRSGYVRNSTNICNYPVQAFATAEIIPAALVMMWHIIKRSDARIVLANTIHDSIIGEVHPDDVDKFHSIARWCLIDGVYAFIEKLYGIRLLCRLGCGVKVAEHWGATKDETKYEAETEQYKEVA